VPRAGTISVVCAHSGTASSPTSTAPRRCPLLHSPRPTAGGHRPPALRVTVPSASPSSLIARCVSRRARRAPARLSSSRAYLGALVAGLPWPTVSQQIVDILAAHRFLVDVAVRQPSTGKSVRIAGLPRGTPRSSSIHPQELHPALGERHAEESSCKPARPTPIPGEHLTMRCYPRGAICRRDPQDHPWSPARRSLGALREPLMAIVKRGCIPASSRSRPSWRPTIVDKGIVGVRRRGAAARPRPPAPRPDRPADAAERDPLTCVVRGAGSLLADLKLLSRAPCPPKPFRRPPSRAPAPFCRRRDPSRPRPSSSTTPSLCRVDVASSRRRRGQAGAITSVHVGRTFPILGADRPLLVPPRPHPPRRSRDGLGRDPR